MTKENDGGSAFPEIETDRESISDKCATGQDIGRTYTYGGMSLRDWFAGKALSGEMTPCTERSIWPEKEFDRLAERCYRVADAMLRERER